MEGLSFFSSASANGKRLAFLNDKTVEGRLFRPDLAIATPDGKPQYRMQLEGIAFSRGAFVGDTLVYYELFKDRYRVRQLDLETGAVAELFTLYHSESALRKLSRDRLLVEGDTLVPQINAPN
jgi:hypothetical protein